MPFWIFVKAFIASVSSAVRGCFDKSRLDSKTRLGKILLMEISTCLVKKCAARLSRQKAYVPASCAVKSRVNVCVSLSFSFAAVTTSVLIASSNCSYDGDNLQFEMMKRKDVSDANLCCLYLHV